MTDTQAIAPTSQIVGSFQKLSTEQEELRAKLTEKQESWALLADHPSYGMFKEYIYNLVRGLGLGLDQAIVKGADDRELAIKLQVVKLTEQNLLSIISNIEQNAKGITSNRGDRVTTG